MPLALGVIAVLAILTGIKGNYAEVGTMFNTTFLGSSGHSGFIKWLGSILGIAIIFRIIGAPRAGQLFIALLIVVYFMENNGVVSALESAIQGGTSAASNSSGSASVPSSTTSKTGAN